MALQLDKPTPDERRLARKSLDELSHLRRGARQKFIRFHLHDSERSIDLPIKALELMERVLMLMSEGHSISLFHAEGLLSTQEAADILKVSRPYFVKLLETKKIPFQRTGKHRRVFLKDLLSYMQIQEALREKSLQALSDQAQELNLGYGS